MPCGPPGCTQGPEYPVRISNSGAGLGQVPINLTCQLAAGLITAAVACLGALYTRPHILLGISTAGAQVRGKVPILTCPALLVPDNSSCCLGARFYMGPNQYPVRTLHSRLRLGLGPNQY
jgi:hypothetical protein